MQLSIGGNNGSALRNKCVAYKRKFCSLFQGSKVVEMNVINIYMQRDARRRLRRERLFRDGLNPLEVYDDLEARNLFRFERIHILSITGDLQEHLRRTTGRSRSLVPLQQVCIALRFYATGSMQLPLAAWIIS